MSDRLCTRLDDLITCLETLQTKGEESAERVPAGLHDLYYHTRDLAADIDSDLAYDEGALGLHFLVQSTSFKMALDEARNIRSQVTESNEDSPSD